LYRDEDGLGLTVYYINEDNVLNCEFMTSDEGLSSDEEMVQPSITIAGPVEIITENVKKGYFLNNEKKYDESDVRYIIDSLHTEGVGAFGLIPPSYTP
jgi:hypothetical protein